MRIIGIDPGLQKTGWGVIERNGNALRYIASGLIKTNPADSLPQRLAYLHMELCKIVEGYSPPCSPSSSGEDSVGAKLERRKAHAFHAAVEETFVNKNPASALKLGQARGVVLAVPALHNIPTAEYAANTIKKSVVGSGHAAKQQIGAMIKVLLPACGQISEDEADALAVAITHANHV